MHEPSSCPRCGERYKWWLVDRGRTLFYWCGKCDLKQTYDAWTGKPLTEEDFLRMYPDPEHKPESIL